jgi:hypothetical protein
MASIVVSRDEPKQAAKKTLISRIRSAPMRRFLSFRLDTANQCLWRGEAPADLTPKAFDVLRYLV